MATELTQREDAPISVEVGFQSSQGFELIQRMAKLLAASALVPKEFQGNVPNVVIALEMARRMGASPLAVMQNLYIVHGKPSWSSQFIIAAVNSTGKFSPLRFRVSGEGDKYACVAFAIEKDTGEVLESPPVSIGMAKAEGWYGRNGSKWQTMPDLMLRYRCATLFGRLYAPEVLMGMQSTEEVIDITPEAPAASGAGDSSVSRSDALAARLRPGAAAADEPTARAEADVEPPAAAAPLSDPDPRRVEPAPQRCMCPGPIHYPECPEPEKALSQPKRPTPPRKPAPTTQGELV